MLQVDGWFIRSTHDGLPKIKSIANINIQDYTAMGAGSATASDLVLVYDASATALRNLSLGSVLSMGVPALTSGRVVIVGTGGVLSDDAGLTYDASTDAITSVSLTLSGDLRLTDTTDASLSSTGHAFQIGSSSGVNLIADNNEMIARNNGATSTLNLNTEGGTVACGGNITGGYIRGTNGLGIGVHVVVTAATHTIDDDESVIIADRAGTVTVTFPSASTYNGRILFFITRQAQAIVSASSNVIPRPSGTAGTALVAAVDGSSCIVISNGTNWQIVMA